MPSIGTEEDVVLRSLTADGVLVHPGYFFDFPANRSWSSSLLPPPDVFADGISRVLRHFDCSDAPAMSAGRPAPGGAAHPAVFLSLLVKLGYRRHRRSAARHAWLAGAGQRVLQLLPLNEMAAGQQSPYSAISAMAIDPIYISVPRRARVRTPPAAKRRSSAADARGPRRACDTSPRVDYAHVRRAEEARAVGGLRTASADEWCRDTARARA